MADHTHRPTPHPARDRETPAPGRDEDLDAIEAMGGELRKRYRLYETVPAGSGDTGSGTVA